MDHGATEAPELESGHPGSDDAVARQMVINMRLTPEQTQYFSACARIRDVSVTELVRRVLTAVGEDQMVGAILDDGGVPAKPRPDHRRRRKV